MQKIDLARLLIDRGANVNCRGEEGGTPLHEAAGNGNLDLAKLLIEHGANINAKDDHGKTPLTIALELSKRRWRSSCATIRRCRQNQAFPWQRGRPARISFRCTQS